jgi:hypothetical protein
VRRSSVPLLLMIIAALVLAGAVPAGASAGHAAKRKCAKTHGKHGAKSSKQSKRPKKCKKAKPKPKPRPKPKPSPAPSQTPVSVDVLDGSAVTLDTGDGSPKVLPLTGTLRGFIEGGYQLARDNTVNLYRGRLRIVPTDVLTDGCIFPAPARTNWATTIDPDPTIMHKVVVARTGAVTAGVSGIVRTVLDLRSAAGCAAPPVTSGYADTPFAVSVAGQIVKETGLARLELTSAPYPLTFNACLAPGVPDQPCAAAPAAMPSTATLRLLVRVEIG